MERKRSVILTLLILTLSCISGEILNGSSGFFSSPNFPNNYPQYSNCTWNITVLSGYIIKINFLHFQLGYISRGGAQLTITNVASTGGTLNGYFPPYPVYSMGNSIQVTFISRANQYPGFNASYTAITYESLCPNLMTLNDTSGVITSPYHPRDYPPNQACSWQITERKGSFIELFIEYMNIQQCGAACTCDYLEIQNGLSSDGVSSARRCGYLFDGMYHVYNDSLKVLFVSDYNDGSYYGFKATYTHVNYTSIPATCISGEFLTGSSGFFSSPNFPNNYPQYSRCTWSITVPSGYIIKISFRHFQLGNRLYGGGAQLTITNSDPHGVVALDGDSLPDPVYSAGNFIHVTFIAHTKQFSGFNASYTAITYESLCPNLMTLNDTSGTITSPYYPRDYGDNHKCSWQITASKGKRIKLVIEFMWIIHLRCGQACACSYLEIQNGSFSSDGVPAGRMCGLLDGSVTLYSFYETLKVLFVSNRPGLPGFRATYTQLNDTASSECSNYRLLDETNRARAYSGITNLCDTTLSGWYRFSGAAGSQMAESCVDGGHCGADAPGWLDGNYPAVADGTVQRRVCFTHFNKCCYYSTHISVRNCGRFYVYKLDRPPHCSLRYCGTGLPLAPECSNYRTLNESNRARTYYNRSDIPFNYGPSAGWYRFSGEAGNQMAESCVDMYHCGTKVPAWLYGSHPAVDDGVVQRRVCFNIQGICCNFLMYINVRNCGGFYVYKLRPVTWLRPRFCGNGFVPPTPATPACTSGEYLNGSSGFFSSPNFPNIYPQNSRCTWNITVPSRCIIKINFLHFQMGWQRDGAQLTIKNVTSGAVTLHGWYPPDPMYSERNSIHVTFTSLTNQYSGFNASYMAITYESLCPNLMTLNDTSGTITSPYYPRPYSVNQACSWKITASKGKRVKLVIEDMDIQPRGMSCTCDYLEIQNGSFSGDGFPAGRICGQLRNTVTFNSFHETLKVLFVSRLSGYRGFRATYTQLNYTASTECSNYTFLNESNRARTYSGMAYVCDTALSGWYRFSGKAGSQMAESCVDRGLCGTDAPGWFDGNHPGVADGTVQRRVCFSNFNNCCHFSTYISVRNCGGFYVYKLDRPPHCNLSYCGNGLLLAPECYNYRFLNESNRARTYHNRTSVMLCDSTLSAGWYRFSGEAGSQMADSCVDEYHCGTDVPGWLNGPHPGVADGRVQRRVCFTYQGICCAASIYISVRNCGGFYVYKLNPIPPVACSSRYCGNGSVPTTPVTPALTTSSNVSTPMLSTAALTTSSNVSTPMLSTAEPPTFLLLSFAETEAVIQLVNRKTLSNGNPVRYFQIIVIPLKKGTGSGNHPEIIKRKYEDQEEGEPYITAEFSKDESRTTFTVGDGKYYWRSGVTEAVTKYLNGKLKSNSQYAVFQRSFDEDGAYENEGIVLFTTKAKGFPTAIVVSVVVVLLVLLILAGAFMVWRRIHRHEIKTSLMHLQHCSTQGWTEMSANINTYIDRTELGSANQNVWGDGCGGRGEGGGGGEPKHSET